MIFFCSAEIAEIAVIAETKCTSPSRVHYIFIIKGLQSIRSAALISDIVYFNYFFSEASTTSLSSLMVRPMVR